MLPAAESFPPKDVTMLFRCQNTRRLDCSDNRWRY